MKVGIVGLGLMGGSLAKAFRHYTDAAVLGCDRIEDVTHEARRIGAIDGVLTPDKLGECDLVMICLCPGDTVEYVRHNRAEFRKGGLVLDICGIKEAVCRELRPIARENGFTFVGAHPMAGREFSGFEYSTFDLFQGASMVLTPHNEEERKLLQIPCEYFTQMGFSNLQFTTEGEHDRLIAFTSQLAHVVSNAYVKSPSALLHHGFSAGSYKDLTRVAKLNEEMWTELFLLNGENLAAEIDGIITHLQEYSDAIHRQDATELKRLLREGRERKESIDR